VTINNITTNTPTNCVSQCHGTHNSYDNNSLIVLRTDGTAFNLNTSYPSPPVTPSDCGECHKQDDGTAVYAFTTLGHGKTPNIGLGCEGCHNSAAKHSFDYTGTNPLRFKYLVNTTEQSAIRLYSAYNSVFSICLTCHSAYAGWYMGGGRRTRGATTATKYTGAGRRLGRRATRRRRR